ncbi:vesicular glutamate transporter 3-like [Planococcus citri]|uniref:vesicular glutamate transporter 3-like n=1 Tax=Planococcus citri TaxID=170843 RepID=UPI0031F7B414
MFPKRYLIVIMVFIGYVIFFGLHTNIGMAVVAMTSPRNISTPNGTIIVKEADFNWTSIQKSTVISSLAYGRFFGPIGGLMAGRIGGSTMYTLGIVSTAFVTFLLPLCLRINFYLFVFGNALTGLFESFAYSSVSQLWSRWAPPNERAKIISVSVIGVYGGPIVSFVGSGWILHEWGWVMLFNVTGIVILIWSSVWFLVVKNDPADDKWMSEAEKVYIKKELNSEMPDDIKLEYPWKDLLTCVPFWIGCLCKFMTGVGFTFTMMYLPQYIKDTNNIDIKSIGYISVIPHVCSIIAMPLTGYLFDYIRSNKLLSLTNAHKLYACLGLLVGAATYMTAGLWPNFTVCIVCVSFFSFFITLLVLEIQVLVLDLAPRYAAFMNSIATSGYTTSSILTPIIVGFIVTSESQLQWSSCFIIFSIQYIVVALLCLKFGSGELQHWANYSSSNKSIDELTDVPSSASCKS